MIRCKRNDCLFHRALYRTAIESKSRVGVQAETQDSSGLSAAVKVEESMFVVVGRGIIREGKEPMRSMLNLNSITLTTIITWFYRAKNRSDI
jgi:hypothetical protein